MWTREGRSVLLHALPPTFAVRCPYCPPDTARVLTTARIADREESILRAHMRAAHPDVENVEGLGELLRHFSVERVPDAPCSEADKK